MKNFNLLKKLIHEFVYRGNISYSQNGEDLSINRIFENVQDGFYVDIGAHHPMRFSNTYLFYQKGWSGINIDAQPGSMRLFKKMRPRDINIEVGVGTSSEEMLFYQFNESALNTFNLLEANSKVSEKYMHNEGRLVKIRRLDSILKESMPQEKEIDFMSIDVEGNELDILLSNDWDLFRPKYLLVEVLRSDLSEVLKNSSTLFLNEVGYIPTAKVFDTVIYEVKANYFG